MFLDLIYYLICLVFTKVILKPKNDQVINNRPKKNNADHDQPGHNYEHKVVENTGRAKTEEGAKYNMEQQNQRRHHHHQQQRLSNQNN